MVATTNTLNVQGYFVLSRFVLIAPSTCFKWIEVQVPERSQKDEIF